MTIFDTIRQVLSDVLSAYADKLEMLGRIVINRDLNGRIRLILDESVQSNQAAQDILGSISNELAEKLGAHGYPAERIVLFESSLDLLFEEGTRFPLKGYDNLAIVDRLATETDWTNIASVSSGVPRIVFFSIKGGVGRSTALAAAAWSLAQEGKRVMVLDMDLESPGLSSSLLPEDRRPLRGVTDWLVEDLVDNGEAVFPDMFAISDLSHDGEIYVVPAHGRDPGEYIAKLGRVWMPKVSADGLISEVWSSRLSRLIDRIEEKKQPDVILIDSRAGIDDIASACVTGLGASGVLLFAIDGDQTWSGYRILFEHWKMAGVVRSIRDRLQLVGSMVPEIDEAQYVSGLREGAWNLFVEEIYDEVSAGEDGGSQFSFDIDDQAAPHYPWKIGWNRGFAAVPSLHARFARVDKDMVYRVFGEFLERLKDLSNVSGDTHA